MTNNGVVQHEVELKFAVLEDAALPGVWPAGFVSQPPREVLLEACYFDTPERDLAQAGVAVRQRRGGYDAGWHIKTRVSDVAQQEVSWPLSESLPAGLAAHLNTLVPGSAERLEELAVLQTRRTVITLCDATLVARFEIADDWVYAVEKSSGSTRAWREWEIEVLTSEQMGLAALQAAFFAAGARPALVESKIARAAGQVLPQAVVRGATTTLLAALAVQELADQLAAAVGAEGFVEGAVAALADPRITELRKLAYRLGEQA